MLNNTEEKLNFNTKISIVSVRSFSGVTTCTEHMKDTFTSKESNVVIIRASTNNVRTDKQSVIVDKLVKLQEHPIKIAPSTKVLRSTRFALSTSRKHTLTHNKLIDNPSLLKV